MRWIKELDDPSEAVAFRISGPEISPLIHQSAPIPRFVTEITPYAAGEKPAFRIRPIPPEAPESARLADFAAVAPDPAWGEQAGHTDFIKVLINPQVEEELLRLRPFSSQAEEGGFLLGQVHEDLEQPETFILSISAAVAAEQVGASFLHFTFTGDSFERIKQRLSQEHRDSRLLGWYHTHLFPATETIGLSSIDFRLHFTTFRIPWQVAGLLNLDGSGRILRFYVRRRDTMLLCHHQTAALERRL
ncbi:MAG: hypothetical protein GY800_00985 [Planctomycetes bacterium]|nr:hypothetical protein [Planctomycetota bacterium]